jgi:hypothetical protein
VKVGTFWSDADSSGFIAEAGSPYSLTGKTWKDKGISQAFICTTNSVVVDYFNATNGQYYPATSAELQHAKKTTTEISKAMSSK